jgi:hypothetical protein
MVSAHLKYCSPGFGAILRLKIKRHIGLAILLSSHMLSSEYSTV